MNEAATKRCSHQNYPPFADNSSGFSGVFPGSPPDPIGPASQKKNEGFFLFNSTLPLICLGAGLFFIPKKGDKK